ncbi:metallophosphoesterase [Melaminivora sp.]|uniref:metallophosphoesterase n=1 Tax=Melaminivora sp. TaxID=1933032 RepID=UPI0028B08AE6|nr:metallophosphoesterase [Melaminivora sp.]
MLQRAVLFVVLFSVWLWAPVQGLPAWQRAIAVVLTALAGCAPMLLLQALQSGQLDYATIARLQVPAGWVLATLCLMLPLVALRDLLWLALRWTAPAAAAGLHGAAATPLALLLAALVTAFGVWQALQPPRVREQPVELARLPAALDGLRVAVLADLHATPVNDARFMQTVVQRTLAAQPDLIVLPGDLVDGDLATTGPHVAPLAGLQAPLGVWVAPGNHEYYSGYDAWMAHFRQLGLQVLENRTQLLQVGDARLALSGIGDPAHGQMARRGANPARPEGIAPDVAAVAGQARAAQADVHLLLAHQPRLARENAGHGIDLQISGHTHGGQILGMDRWLTARFNDGFVRGLYEVGAMRLFVSNGAGLWAGFAVRLGVPPHIDLLVLRRPASAP